jgi:hypothetical protein
VTNDVASREDWSEEFDSVTKGVSNQTDWRLVVVEDPVREIELLSGDDVGWNSSCPKREC